jgi:membrane-bound lytic murein transglycosylase D
VSLDEFKALNPAHNRPVILQHSADVLLLPVDKIETFRSNLEANDKPLVSWQAYQSHKGERLDKLAPRFGLSLEKLRAVNSLSARAKISNGQTLLVPIGSEAIENNDTEFEAFNTHLVPSEPAIARGIKHTVRKGDSLVSIARRYHVNPAKLKSWNSELGRLKVGQTLTIVQTTTGRKLLARPSSRSQLASVRGGKKQLTQLKKSSRAKLSSARNGKKYAARKARRVAVAYNR